MIQLTGAAKRFGPKVLFENLDWLVTPNERVGFVGANGSGKTTLLRILAGLEGLDAGSVSKMKGITIGYLPQDGLTLSGRTVFDECMTVFNELHAMEKEQETLAHKMSEIDPASPEYAQVSERFHRIQSEFHARAGYSLESQAGAVLSGLGFPPEDWIRRTEEFSGGWQMRIALAAAQKSESAAARRVDESSGPGSTQVTRTISPVLSECVRADLPRPLLPRRDREEDRSPLEQAGDVLHRQFHEVRRIENRAAGATAGGCQQSARPYRAARSIHQPLSRAGHQGETGAEPD
jgi:ABC-type dipeptide/oligopeptide/nickel transport system ATPase subunit